MMRRPICALLLLSCAVAALPAANEPVYEGYWRGRKVHFRIEDGMAVAEGDIILGAAHELLAGDSGKATEDGGAGQRSAAAASAESLRWPNGVVVYQDYSSLPNPQRIADAIRHWEQNTPIRFVRRTTESNYVEFRSRADTCSSNVGMVGGRQTINLDDTGCQMPQIVHEIGHALGLHHEQSRQDRDFYVKLRYENIAKIYWDQYNKELTDAFDVGPYDYGSIMHYFITDFGMNRANTMEAIPLGIPVGQRSGLSPGDIAAIKALYRSEDGRTVLATYPAGMRLVVDGQTVTTPVSFDWPEGSQHTVEAPDLVPVDGNTRFRFGRWSDNAARVHTITASRDQPWFSANYRQQFRVPVAVSGGGRVVLSPAPADGFYTLGETVELRAIPNNGWRFVNWTGAGYLLSFGNANNPYRVPLNIETRNFVQYTANFTQGPVTTIDTTHPGTRVTIDGSETTLPTALAWAPGTQHTLTLTAAQRSQTLYDADRYVFQGWSTGEPESVTVTAGAESSVVTARWTRQWQVTVRSNSVRSRVSVSPPGAGGFYDEGTTLTLTAVPAPGSGLFGWEGDLAGGELVQQLVVNDQKLMTAYFMTAGALAPQAVVNAASYQAGAVAPGELVTMFGLRIGPAVAAGTKLEGDRLATTIGGTQVLFDGAAAPMVYTSGNQISALVPYAVAGRSSVRVEVQQEGRTLSAAFLNVTNARPGLFTANSSGEGNCACNNQNGSPNGPGNPAPRGSVVVLYATGEGLTNPVSADGKIATAGSLPRPVEPVRVRLAGREIPVEYAGAAPALAAGIMQVNVRLPVDAPTGNVPVQLILGARGSSTERASLNTVTIAIQ